MKLATTLLVFCVAALLALGTVMLCSAPTGSKFVTQQMVWAVLGLIGCVTAARVDYRRLQEFSWVFYGVAVLMLILVLIPHIGWHINGARRWFKIGPMSFQPSEFAKLALIFAIAWYGARYQRQMPKIKRGLLMPALFILPVLALIFREPDYGTTLLLAAVSAVMLIVAGVRLRLVLPVVLVGLVAIGISVWKDPNRLARVVAFTDVEQFQLGKGLQQYHAMLALGSGGPTGVGLGDGRHKFYYIPENHTDFILSIVGEELGLVATLGVVLAFVAIALCGVTIATRARDSFGMLLACGITFLIGFQAFINMGVVTTLLPNKGLALPFVSYGGSSLVMMMTSVGVLLSVARQAHEPVRRASGGFNPFSSSDVPSTQVS